MEVAAQWEEKCPVKRLEWLWRQEERKFPNINLRRIWRARVPPASSGLHICLLSYSLEVIKQSSYSTPLSSDLHLLTPHWTPALHASLLSDFPLTFALHFKPNPPFLSSLLCHPPWVKFNHHNNPPRPTPLPSGPVTVVSRKLPQFSDPLSDWSTGSPGAFKAFLIQPFSPQTQPCWRKCPDVTAPCCLCPSPRWPSRCPSQHSAPPTGAREPTRWWSRSACHLSRWRTAARTTASLTPQVRVGCAEW